MTEAPDPSHEPSHKPLLGVRAWLGQIFSIDTRSLAALRIGIGLVLIWEALRNATVFRHFFLEDGLTPSFIFDAGAQKWQSVFFISTSPVWTYGMFALQIVLALMLIIGYRTRLATIGCFVMAWSVVNRNNLIASGGHNLLCWMLIWSIFLPLGAAASVDAKTAKVQERDVLSAATIGILLQLVFLYAVACAAKLNVSWYSDLNAVHGFLRSHIGNPLGRAITLLPEFTAMLCVATLLLESLGPTLALISGGHWLRTVIVLVFIGFHLGLSATLYIGAFGWICIAAWMIYLPGSFWDLLHRLRPWHLMTSAWNAFMQQIADRINTVPTLAVRSMRMRPGFVATVFVWGLIGMMAIWNFTTMVPSLGRMIPGSSRKFKQVWTVMDVPWQVRLRLAVEADCADGSQVTLIEPSVHAISPRWFDYFWPPERGPELGSQVRLMRRAFMQQPNDQAFTTYFKRLRDRWNDGHQPAKRIVRARAIVIASPIPPPAARSLNERTVTRHVFYEWSDAPDNPAGLLTYHPPP